MNSIVFIKMKEDFQEYQGKIQQVLKSKFSSEKN